MRPSPWRSPKYIVVLAVVSALILIVGSSLRPRPKVDPGPSESELARLARLSERRSLDNMTGYFAAVANDLTASVVRVVDDRLTGVVWNNGLVVTPVLGRRVPDVVTIATPSGQVRSTVTVRGPVLPLAAVQVPDAAGLTPARRPVSSARTGDWIVAVWTSEQERPFAVGHFTDSSPASCGDAPAREIATTLSLTPRMAGGGVFDADGNLLAVILPCGDRIAAIDAASVDAMLASGNSAEGRLLARYGLRLSRLTEAETSYFKIPHGLLVREVWMGYPGANAGLVPGDVVRALDDAAVSVMDDLRSLTGAEELREFTLTVQRKSAGVKITFPAAVPEPPAVVDRGIGWGPPVGFPIEAVSPGSPAAIAGIGTGDRLIRIDRTVPRDAAQVRRLLAASNRSPVFVEIERDGRRLGVLVR